MAENDENLIDVSLEQMMGLDVSGIDAKSFGDPTPKMAAEFTWEKAELKKVPEKKTQFLLQLTFNIDKCIQLIDPVPGSNASDFDGKKHIETQVIDATRNESMEYALGTLKSLGVDTKDPTKNFQQKYESGPGKRYTGIIIHQRDKNDPDRVYSRMARMKSR